LLPRVDSLFVSWRSDPRALRGPKHVPKSPSLWEAHPVQQAAVTRVGAQRLQSA